MHSSQKLFPKTTDFLCGPDLYSDCLWVKFAVPSSTSMKGISLDVLDILSLTGNSMRAHRNNQANKISQTWNNKLWYAVEALWTLNAHRGSRTLSKRPSGTMLRFRAAWSTMLSSRTGNWVTYILTLGTEITCITLSLRSNQSAVVTVVTWSTVCAVCSLL